MDAKNRKLTERLRALYPNPRSELNFSNEYQLFVSVVLSAQCTDKKVNEITPSLFKRYADFHALAKASAARIEEIIRPINYYGTNASVIMTPVR